MFSGPPKSSLAWESGSGGFTIHGHVVSVDGAPLPVVGVRLTPGSYGTMADKSGSFTIPNVRGGRYLIKIVSVGRVAAKDSITVGDNGLNVRAVLASYTGDILCVRVPGP